MMTEIKYALAFAFGALFTSCWWSRFTDRSIDLLTIVLSIIVLVIALLCLVIKHWLKE